MRESCTYGSVRGALSNERSYRESDYSSSLQPIDKYEKFGSGGGTRTPDTRIMMPNFSVVFQLINRDVLRMCCVFSDGIHVIRL